MISAGHVWRQITDLLADATETAVIIAPFIKKPLFDASLAAIPPGVKKIDCVTRWSPAEVAAGVSDPEIAETARADDRVRLRLCPTLHAKIYVADGRCLVGSANFTAKATGQAPEPNIELLIETAVMHPEVQHVLHQVDQAATEATTSDATLVREQADFLSACRGSQPPGELPPPWYPVTRRPECLYKLYCGHATFTPMVQAGITQDLAMLDVPAGLTEQAFNAAIRGRLHALPELKNLTANKRIGNQELQKAIETRTDLDPDHARRITETLAAWLTHFGTYYTEVSSWELRHGHERR